MASSVRISDGSLDFSLGVDAGRVTTVQSPANPNGLSRQMLAWGSNITVRGGGIKPRAGWNYLTTIAPPTAGLYQGGWLYEQQTGNPYPIVQIGGFLYAIRTDEANQVIQLTVPGQLDVNNKPVSNPATVLQAYFCQAEQFLIIQPGDWQQNVAGTLPLFYDGATVRRSVGIIGPNNTPTGGQLPLNEIPSALAMTYFQDRVWYANGRSYSGGDIVDGPSGSAQYNLADSVLKVTENPLAIGGDGFTVPSQAGNITALSYTAQLDASLGQGNLYIFTRRQVNSLVVPVSRLQWTQTGNSSSTVQNAPTNMPQQLVALTRYGSNGDRSIVRVNGDLFFGSPEPAVRSLTVATRYFEQWGNVPISRNVQRALNYTAPTLLSTQTGIEFDNRLLMGVLPIQTHAGVAFQGIVALDFDLISTLQEKLPPAWEGVLEGLDVLQLFEGDYGGTQRAFAVVHSRLDQSIQLWELLQSNGNTPPSNRFDNNDTRIEWRFETPAYTWNREFDQKQLDGCEIWLDDMAGTIDFTVQYREDASPCWQNWVQVQICSARNSNEFTATATQPGGTPYPIQITYCMGQKFCLTLPAPQPGECDVSNQRPTNRGYQFQARVTGLGYCRVRGFLIHGIPVERQPFENVNCTN